MTLNKYRIEKVDYLTYTEEDWQDYFDFRAKSYALKGELMPFGSVDELKTANVKRTKESGIEVYQVWKNRQENGILVFAIEFKDDLKKRFTYLKNHMIDEYLDANLLEMIFKQYIDYDETSNFLVLDSKNGMNDYVTDLFNA